MLFQSKPQQTHFVAISKLIVKNWERQDVRISNRIRRKNRDGVLSPHATTDSTQFQNLHINDMVQGSRVWLKGQVNQ